MTAHHTPSPRGPDAPEVRLVQPRRDMERAFRSMALEWRAFGDDRFAAALQDFARYVARLRNIAAGRGLGPGLVPQTTYWLLRRDGMVVGTSRLRHRLNAELERRGGHIGYDIRPLQRRRGYGTRILALTLQKARAMGLRRVLLTCDSNNVGSARIIRKNGGRLQDEVELPETGRPHSRYWIEL